MLTFEWSSVVDASVPPADHPVTSVADSNPELRVRDLLDDPRLRACMSAADEVVDVGEPVVERSDGLPTRVRGTSMSAALRDGVLRAAA
jgi:hypothetical protein